MDYERKKKLYEESGVEEYWIVDLNKEQVKVYRFTEDDHEGDYSEDHSKDHSKDCFRDYSFEETVRVGIYDDLELDLRMLKEYLDG